MKTEIVKYGQELKTKTGSDYNSGTSLNKGP